MPAKIYRSDQLGEHRTALDRNKKKIYATQKLCGICGQPVDFSLRYPNPMSKTVDHIIPINRGGHPSDLANLQLAHLSCNRQKSDKVLEQREAPASVGIILTEIFLNPLTGRASRPDKGGVPTSAPLRKTFTPSLCEKTQGRGAKPWPTNTAGSSISARN